MEAACAWFSGGEVRLHLSSRKQHGMGVLKLSVRDADSAVSLKELQKELQRALPSRWGLEPFPALVTPISFSSALEERAPNW